MTGGPPPRGPAGSPHFPDAWWTPERAALHRWLEDIASHLAPVYLGGLRMAMDESFPGRVHFVAHAIREIRNRIRDVFAGETEVKESTSGEEDTNRGVIGSFLESIGGEAPPLYVVNNWFNETNWAVSHAHVGNEQQGHEASEVLVSRFVALEDALLGLMSRLYEILDVMDDTLETANSQNGSWYAPNVDVLQRLESFIHRPESRAYFFDRLNNPMWVTELRERRVFEHPPNYELGDDRVLLWPEGRYLVRMAPLVPNEVSSILLELPRSENPTVTRSLLDAARSLPQEHLRRMAHKVVDWVQGPRADFFADEAASVIGRLLRAGKVKQADHAARVLLSLRANPDQTRSWETVVGRVPEWEYGRVLTTVLSAFVDEAGLKGVKLFSWLLGKALRIARSQGQLGDWDDRSCVWRPAIEDHQQNSETGIFHLLVSATRDASIRHAVAGESQLEETIQHLESRGSVLHQRIALHVLAMGSLGADLAADRFVDRELFDDYRLRHEYASLARHRFGDVSTEAQRAYLGWVEKGPDLEKYRRSPVGAELTKDERTALVCGWQRDKLSFITDHLRGETSERYRQLVADYGEPRHPDFPFWTESFQGDQSPVRQEEVTKWSPTDVIEYLRTWHPASTSGWGPDHSMEGLGRVFKGVVEERVSEFVPFSADIATLDPTYVRSFLEGLRAASKGGGVFSWAEPLKLMASVVRYPFDPSDEVTRWDRDYDWRPTRQALVWCLQAGCSDSNSQIPFDLREAAWSVLELLTEDPEPWVGRGETDGVGDMDPYHRSVNTVRGSALHAVVEYALWCRRALDARGVATNAGFGLMSEVRAMLERHLDTRIEPTLTVRSVYGKWLPWLLLLDEDWVVANLEKIFPTDPRLAGLRDAAWSTYIGWCPAYDSVFAPLRSEYEDAVERVPSGGTFDLSGQRDVDVKLGEHLVVLYWRRVAPRSLLDRFFQQATADQAGAVMGYVGRVLLNSEEIAESVCQRIQELWSRRLDVITASPGRHRREVDAFSITFAAAKLDTRWELDQFDRVLHTHQGSTAYTRRVIERLAHLAEDDPITATRLTLTLLEGADNEWRHRHWRKHVRSLLIAACDNAPRETTETRRAIIDHYVSRGEFDFRELL